MSIRFWLLLSYQIPTDYHSLLLRSSIRLCSLLLPQILEPSLRLQLETIRLELFSHTDSPHLYALLGSGIQQPIERL